MKHLDFDDTWYGHHGATVHFVIALCNLPPSIILDPTGYGTHPTFENRDSFPGIKRPGRDVYRPPPSSAEVKERAELDV